MGEQRFVERLNGAASFNPEQIKILGQAFDGAWTRIEGGLSNREGEIEFTRDKLAKTILKIADSGVVTAQELQDEAINRMFAQPFEL